MDSSFERTVGHAEWLTPKYITDELGPFTLDPCSPLVRPWNTADHHYTEEDDGLSQDWEGEFVWCNPPYGTQTGKWLEKMAEHNNGIALIFARTETNMFFDNVWNAASTLLFLKGRLKFHYVDGTQAAQNAGAPSVLVAYGDSADNRLLEKHTWGKLIKL